MRAPKPQREQSASDPYRPLNHREKLDYWVDRTHAPATFIGAGLDTAIARASGDFRYCCGMTSWGQQYAAILVDKQTRMFFGRYFFPTILSQDPRYLPKREGSVLARGWYAASRVFITRNDEGHATFNSSEMLSVAFSKALSNAYYPERDRTLGGTAGRIYGTLQSDAIDNLLTEFMPDIKRIFKRHTPKRLAGIAGKMPFTSAKEDESEP